MAGIALVFLATYTVEVLVQPTGLAALTVNVVTKVCWAVFVMDYLARFWLADDRKQWFRRHLIDLAIVVLPVLRPLRLVRLVILVSALQKAVGTAIRGKVLVYAATSTALLVYVASLAVLQAERDNPNASIASFGQAVWWAITTITTVGYGDEYPVTTTGRIVAALLMIGGISLLGAVTATFASWIVDRVAEDDSTKQAATAAQIEDLRDEIRGLREELASSRTSSAN